MTIQIRYSIRCFSFIIFFLYFVISFAQRTIPTSINVSIKDNSLPKIVIHPEDPIFPIEIMGAVYDPEMNNIPVWIQTFTTAINENAEAQLEPIVVSPLNSEEANVVKKFFGKHITNEFQIKYFQSYSGNTKVWSAYIIPFRKNTNENIEFLQ